MEPNVYASMSILVDHHFEIACYWSGPFLFDVVSYNEKLKIVLSNRFNSLAKNLRIVLVSQFYSY